MQGFDALRFVCRQVETHNEGLENGVAGFLKIPEQVGTELSKSR